MTRLPLKLNPPLTATLVYLVVWLAVTIHRLASPGTPSAWLHYVQLGVFLAALPVALGWSWWARRKPVILRNAVLTVAYVLLWHLTLYAADGLELYEFRAFVARGGLAGLFAVGLAWAVWQVESLSRRIQAARAAALRLSSESAGADQPSRAATSRRRTWNPLDVEAWYYGRNSKKLNQSLATLGTYSAAFLALFLLFNNLGGCQEIYEMPAGGGQQQALVQQTVKLQKVIKKKFVINPFSAIIFNPPPIDEIKLQLTEVTQHAYTVGYGEGAGAGFAGGTSRGKVRFIRLEYAGGDWNQDFGIGADLNMLIQYGVRTSHPVNNQTEARTVSQLGNFVVGKSPPVMYLTGQRNISLSKPEIKTLREYLLDQHGMLFGDNGGSAHFHNQFFAAMRQVLPSVEPVRVPLDDVIHRVPYTLPFLPFVAPHGGKDAWGWKVDGRWVCYYHPGDIGDAWSDGHSGVDARIYTLCFQLGVNVFNYAHTEYNRWLMAQRKK